MARKLNLQSKLEEILGSRYVYFQPPESVKLNFPAIVYSVKKIDSQYANNIPYIQSRGYKVTVIDYEPDSEIAVRVSQLPMCKHESHFASDDLHHDVFTLYY